MTNDGRCSLTWGSTTSKSYDYLNRLLLITNYVAAAGAERPSFAYAYNSANQRTAITNENAAHWLYGYDMLGQVTNGTRRWSDGSPVLGQQFAYLFDDIGNRKTAISGGDANGNHLRLYTYSANALNQYTSRTVPGWLEIHGTATNTATVTVNTVATSRKSDYFRTELSIPNGSAAVWQRITNVAVLASGTNDYVTNWTGSAFVPQTPEKFTFDLDGNQTSDGRWTNRWDGENRLISQTSHASGPNGSRYDLRHGYDSQARRISKVVSNWTGSAWAKLYEQRFVHDGWNLVAILDENNAVQVSFAWGTDLSGSMQGAGGVGGLISMTIHSGAWAGTYFYAFDGNGNVAALISAYDGTVVARYEYDPFHRLLRATGPLAFTNPFVTSTKFCDWETGLLYYGYRFYDPSTGRWWSRDPLAEKASQNLFSLLDNDCVNSIDLIGLVDTKFRVVTGDPTSDASIGAFSGTWGQPWWSADGSYQITDNFAESSVTILSVSSAGGSCNTVDKPEPSGTITLLLRDSCPGLYEVTIQATVFLRAVGPQGAASGSVSAGNSIVISHSLTTPGQFSEARSATFRVRLTKYFKEVAQYTPTIGVSIENQRISSGTAEGVIRFVSAKKTLKQMNRYCCIILGLVLLIQGCDRRSREVGLFDAVETGDVVTAKRLIGEGVGVNIVSERKFGWTPLMAATFHGRTNMAVFLIESGANINLRARNGQTALMIAISQGDNALPLVHSLLQRGADLTIKDNSGNTALDYARSVPEKPKVLSLLQLYLISEK